MKLSVSSLVPSVEERSSDSSHDEREEEEEEISTETRTMRHSNLLMAALDSPEQETLKSSILGL